MRPFIAVQDSAVPAALVGRSVSCELREVIGECPANFAGEKFVHRRDGTCRLVQGNAFDAIHRKKDGGKPDEFAVRLVELTDKMVERIQINPAQRDAGRINVQKLAPDFFLWRVQTYDDDGMWIHGLRLVLRVE